ncbi:hypothetical protein O6P43_016621 [Quillaja saponaria]|uniref:Uncharacterized protein n=1 Tax=Quillaja saponaria TaxID=32244 RepID=A0AAD7PMI0_QUISA|nr:hypothetical protein O6P43_016621 [Quillaja saponaria]
MVKGRSTSRFAKPIILTETEEWPFIHEATTELLFCFLKILLLGMGYLLACPEISAYRVVCLWLFPAKLCDIINHKIDEELHSLITLLLAGNFSAEIEVEDNDGDDECGATIDLTAITGVSQQSMSW